MWRNGRRNGLKIRYPERGVRVRVPPSAPPGSQSGREPRLTVPPSRASATAFSFHNPACELGEGATFYMRLRACAAAYIAALMDSETEQTINGKTVVLSIR